MKQNGTEKLTVFSTLAVRAPFDNGVMAEYANAGRFQFEWSPTTVIEAKMSEGRQADLVIATDSAIARMVDAGLLCQESLLSAGHRLLWRGGIARACETGYFDQTGVS
ncbi:hypothetical protein ACQFN5_07785 [Klebsiella sp. WOUb02]|uniref:hypothetical protein n=1 Tax=Klebsiella sp. WOUb02 TaxID=3161071 RepID=UPI003CE70085